jgi:hypothetical protein
MEMTIATPARRPEPQPVALKTVALPAEHGGWGFLAEPLILGLLVAPSGRGAALAAAAAAAFLARHPLKLVLADRLRGRTYPRTRAAAAFALGYGALAALALAIGTRGAPLVVWTPLLIAAPLALVQLACDARRRGRELAPELLGAVAPGSFAASIAIAGGWPAGGAAVLWLLLALRGTATVLYVRTRLRLDRGLLPGRSAAWASHALGLVVVVALAASGLAGWPAVAAFALLLARALHGLSPMRRSVRPQVLGFQELAYGLLTAVLLGIR